MKPETVFVQLPPDLPVFIKNASEGKGDYRDKWYQFLKRAHDCSFLVNPRPKFTSDVVMHGDKLKRLFQDNIVPCTADFEVGANSVYTQGSKVQSVTY